MADFINVPVVLPLDLSMRTGRYHGLHPVRLCVFDNLIAVVALVSEEEVCAQTLYERQSLCAISDGTRRDRYSERKTKRVHGQMYFGVAPPFVRPMASLPPLAPAACG